MKPCIIEARINEYKMREDNGMVPWTRDEIVREAVRVQEAGAAVLHMHARTEDGRPEHSVEKNAELIQQIRRHTDLLIHSTLGFDSNDKSPVGRIQNIRRLCEIEHGGPDIVPIDPGTLNLEIYDRERHQVLDAGNIYENSTETILMSAKEFSSLGLHIQFFCWGVSFVRRAAMVMELDLLKEKPHFVFHLTGGTNISSNPPTKLGLDSMLEVLPPKAVWGVACGGASMFELLPYILEKGGNVSIGIGDYHYAELGEPDNASLILRVRETAEEAGRAIATIDEAKQILCQQVT